jgi:hypothetical protein
MSAPLVPGSNVPGSPGTPPGWYPDPSGSGRERRWDGTIWVGEPHDPPRPSAFGDEYTRGTWTIANSAARRGRTIGLVAVALFVLAIVLVAVGLGAVIYPLVTFGLGAFALTVVVELVALPFVIVGLVRSRRLGGRVTGVLNLIGGSIALLLSVGVFVVLAISIALILHTG